MKANQPIGPRVIDVELLALDLTACTRCVNSLANIEAAVVAIRPVLEATGASVTLRKRIVGSEEEARRLRFVSSPTIRVNGRDVALDLLESPCQSCTDRCGCAEGTNCRVWRYRGEEYPEAPVGLIMEKVLLAVLTDDGPEVPENLRRFFAGKAARVPAESCCSTAERATCCDADRKEGCCDESEPATCGCR